MPNMDAYNPTFILDLHSFPNPGSCWPFWLMYSLWSPCHGREPVCGKAPLDGTKSRLDIATDRVNSYRRG